MSQIKFKTKTDSGLSVEVMAGWDRPMSHYFLTIFHDPPPDDDEVNETVWSCMNIEGSGGGFTGPHDGQLQDLKLVLSGFNIKPPAGFRELLAKQEGNAEYEWTGTGWKGGPF